MASYNNSSLDADMDSFLDYSGGSLQSPTSAMDPMSSMISTEHADERQVLSGPSHEYSRFKQQTGLPSGAMSSMNVFGDMVGDNDFMSQGPLGQNLNSNPQSFVSMDMGGYGSGIAFDMDYENTPTSAMPAFFFPGTGSDTADFAESSGMPVAYNTPVTNPPRLWPGMHSQQAEQARAEASAKQQRQQLQGQQIMQQRQREQSISSQMSSASRKSRAPSQAGADPVADERISRLLDNMRHNSTMSPVEEESNPLEDNAARTAKMRKEEEEMDEDERLLASEEGKKLSSKERRQLRNKVSARAFRSRRKEYISQLEGEVASKNNEYMDLKNQNRKLADENSQLKHLTRTLLSHPAFQTFLEDISRDPSVIAPFQNSIQSAQEMTSTDAQSQSQSQGSAEEESTPSPNETQVNVAGMPNDSLDYSMLDLGNNNWGPGHTNFNFQQPQVFAVTDVPEGPSFAEITVPRIPTLKSLGQEMSDCSTRKSSWSSPGATSPVSNANFETSLSTSDDPCFALYSEPSPRSRSLDRKDHLKSTPKPSKNQSNMDASTDLSKELDDLFESVGSSLGRIDRLTSHLPRP